MSRLSDLEFFQTVASYSTLKAASQALGVTAAAVSQHLADMEKRLGVTLLRRSTRSHNLTDEGKQYLQRGGELLKQLVDLEEEVSNLRFANKGGLRICSSIGFGRLHIADLISKFQNTYPQIRVDMVLSGRALDLIEGGFDLAIRLGEPKDSKYVALMLKRNSKYLYASPSYLTKVGPIRKIEDLRKVDSLMIHEYELTHGVWRLCSKGVQQLVRSNVVLSCNDGEVAMKWCAQGHGVIQRSEWSAEPYVKAGKIVKILPKWSVSADVYALFLSQKRSARLNLFIDFLKKEFGKS